MFSSMKINCKKGSNFHKQLQRWKAAFADVGALKGCHIGGVKFDRSEMEYNKDVTVKMLMNRQSRIVSEGLVGIDDQNETIFRLIEQEDSLYDTLRGMGGLGKTVVADLGYKM